MTRRAERDRDGGLAYPDLLDPVEPTRLRATVWGRLKGLGAIYLQNSAAALPASSAAERALRKLHREILEMSGTAVPLSSTVLTGATTVPGRSRPRDDGYEDIVDRCQGSAQLYENIEALPTRQG